MDPPDQFCHNPDCSDRGQSGLGNIRVHSRKEQRYCWSTCERTFAATTGTPFYRLRTAPEVVTVVLSLLCQGCPLQAIVAAFGFDERTVAQWQARAGEHCQEVHQHLLEQGQVELGQVQADELWVKLVGKRLWMAMALAVPSRLGLGGVISPHRARALVTELVHKVRACARSLAILVCVDGLASYVTALLRVFRDPLRTGRRGRPRLIVESGLLIGQVIKGYARRRGVKVVHRVVRGTATAIAKMLKATGGTVINTASIERLNATFRGALAPLARRGRAIAHTEAVLTAGMYSLGCAYNFCWYHDSLGPAAPENAPRKWQEWTPAMAAGLTEHRWTLRELLLLKVPLPPWVAPKRQGRPPKLKPQPEMAMAA
jgi:transposase-like protein/uncharacterized membrane protein (Fun14 family)